MYTFCEIRLKYVISVHDVDSPVFVMYFVNINNELTD